MTHPKAIKASYFLIFFEMVTGISKTPGTLITFMFLGSTYLYGNFNFALIKGNLKKNKNPRVRVISSNIIKNYLMGEKLPNSFHHTIEHFKNHKDCVLVFVRDTNLKSVSETLRGYKSKKFYKTGQDKLIRNYGIGAQIIKSLNIKNMILVTRSKKKVVGLDGYGIKITKQEIIK